MTSRRGFLGALAAALVLDPERALWVPGKRLISVPAPPPDPLWLQISFYQWIGETPAHSRREFENAKKILFAAWRRHEQRAGRTLTPLEIPQTGGTYVPPFYLPHTLRDGRFPVRMVQIYDPLRDRVIRRLDIASAEGIAKGTGAALAPFVTG